MSVTLQVDHSVVMKMFQVKLASRVILVLTVISVCVLLTMKFIEIQIGYPRSNFCLTCPNMPNASVPRLVERQLNFNLMILGDFSCMMGVISLFALEKYYKHPTFLFTMHCLRMVFNLTALFVTGAFGKLFRPMLKEFCGLGGQCTDVMVLAHTNVGLLYILYFALMITTFTLSTFLVYYCPGIQNSSPSPIISRLPNSFRRSRPYEKLPLTFSTKTSPSSSYKRSPSPPTKMRVAVPPSMTSKSHHLSAVGFSSFGNSKRKIVPFSVPLPHLQEIAA